MTTVKNIYDYIDSIAPYATQEEWDNSGHLLGDFRREVRRVVMSLDPTAEVCDFAVDIGADLVLTHHPIIFAPLHSIPADTAVYKLISADVAMLCAHTNFDMSDCGTNINLAAILGLTDVHRLDDGITVVGDLPQDMSIDDLAQMIDDTLDVAGIRYTDTDRIIRRIGICTGAGEEYQQSAMQHCDCFLTGEMKYHSLLDAQQRGEAVIIAGHYETESAPFLMLRERLTTMFPDVEFITAPVTNPIKSL